MTLKICIFYSAKVRLDMRVLMMIVVYWFSISAHSLPLEKSLAGIAVISDIHLYNENFDFEIFSNPEVKDREQIKAKMNLESYLRVLAILKNQENLQAIIVNGDIFHAPTMLNLADESRIQKTIDFLVNLSRYTRQPVYFNFGNHDLVASVIDKKYMLKEGYAQKFQQALQERVHSNGEGVFNVYLIGASEPTLGDYKAVYSLTIQGQEFRIGHAPFVTTTQIIEDAEVYKDSGPVAFKKNTQVPLVRENKNGVIYIQSDSHTPAADHDLGVYNTGRLTVDNIVPFTEPTFLVIENGKGIHYTVSQNGPVAELKKYQIPTSRSVKLDCRKFYWKK